jgi:hypothetical protein
MDTFLHVLYVSILSSGRLLSVCESGDTTDREFRGTTKVEITVGRAVGTDHTVNPLTYIICTLFFDFYRYVGWRFSFIQIRVSITTSRISVKLATYRHFRKARALVHIEMLMGVHDLETLTICFRS